jgi:hypothetical protein
VDQLLALVEIVMMNAVVAAPIVAIVLFIRQGVDLETGGPYRYAEPGWPRGVQEEDVPHWHVELAHPRGRDAAPSGRPGAARPLAQGCEVAPAR